MRAEIKGLVPKYAVYPNSSAEANKDCRELRADKIEYAQDDEGRIWRRITRYTSRYGWRNFSETTRWHVADMYAWYPGEDPAQISGARRQNTRARPPKKTEAYFINNKVSTFVR